MFRHQLLHCRARPAGEVLVKSTYFRHAGNAPVAHPGLPAARGWGPGIHVTIDQGGVVRFELDVECVEQSDYAASASRKDQFVAVN